MASSSQTTICDLPDEVMISIFSYLSVADMAWCAATCERWREVVTGFAYPWKGKEYRSNRSPNESAEMRAVIHALPPFQKVNLKLANGLHISYPNIDLSVKCTEYLRDCQRLRCNLLSTSMDMAGDFLFHRSTIDFERLQHLRIVRTWTPNFTDPNDYSADYVIRTALSLCPSLKQLSVCTDSMSAEHLDEMEGLGQLQSLEMSCHGLKKLSFLRHCSGALEELQLMGCNGLPSRELVELQQLRNLRTLRLSDCRFEQGDMVAAVAGLGNLESLQLECCSLIRDLSILQHCGRLQELIFTNSYVFEPLVQVMLGAGQLRLQDLRLPADTDFRLVQVVGVTVTADDLSAALSRLEQLDLTSSCLAYLGALRHCSHLRRLCCEFVSDQHGPQLSNVRVHIILTQS